MSTGLEAAIDRLRAMANLSVDVFGEKGVGKVTADAASVLLVLDALDEARTMSAAWKSVASLLASSDRERRARDTRRRLRDRAVASAAKLAQSVSTKYHDEVVGEANRQIHELEARAEAAEAEVERQREIKRRAERQTQAAEAETNAAEAKLARIEEVVRGPQGDHGAIASINTILKEQSA